MTPASHHRRGEEGYLLIGLVVACFLILLALSVAAPRVARELERDKEVEAEHRAQEYVRAIQLYYRRNNSFPTSVEQLLGANPTGAVVTGTGQVKYLRQQYKDPLTNDEFRLIHVSEAQTEVKGFFGEPLQGMPVGLGAAAGMASTSGMSSIGTPAGAASSTANAGGLTGGGGPTFGSASTTTGQAGQAGSTGTSSSTDATKINGSKGAIVGVGSNAKGHGLVEWNGSEDISQWEFLYDPRVEILKAKVSIFGGTPAASGNGSLGSGFGPATNPTPTPTSPTTPTAPTTNPAP